MGQLDRSPLLVAPTAWAKSGKLTFMPLRVESVIFCTCSACTVAAQGFAVLVKPELHGFQFFDALVDFFDAHCGRHPSWRTAAVQRLCSTGSIVGRSRIRE